MNGLFVLGTGGSGKTAICLAIALRLLDSGAKVGYFKPVGNVGSSKQSDDRDASLMKELLGMPAELDCIVPYHTSPSYLARSGPRDEMLSKIHHCFHEIAQGVNYVIVEGTTSPQTMMALGLDALNLAKELDVTPLLVSRAEVDYSLDEAVLYMRYLKSLGVTPGGVIFNNVPLQNLDKCRGVYTPVLEDEGYKVLGVIPKNVDLAAPTVRELVDVLGGEILEGQDYLDRTVEEVMIGAMTPETALNYFHRSMNKAVIAGGDRPLIAMAALETNTSVLILTGGIYPDIRVLTKAAERKVPVLLVPFDTYSTVEKLHCVSRKILASDAKAIDAARNHLRDYCDLAAIDQLLGSQLLQQSRRVGVTT